MPRSIRSYRKVSRRICGWKGRGS